MLRDIIYSTAISSRHRETQISRLVLSSFAALYVFTESDVSQFFQQEEYIESDSMHKGERCGFDKYKTEYSTVEYR